MKHPITLHYLGIRKDSGKGALWGYFSLKSAPELAFPRQLPTYDTYTPNRDPDGWSRHYCYVFTGKVGKSIHIEKKLYTPELVAEFSARSKNYKPANIETMPDKWGKAIDDELSLFLTYATLCG